MSNTKEQSQNSIFKTGFILLSISLLLFIVKEIIYSTMGMIGINVVTTIAYIGAGALVLVSVVKSHQRNNNILIIVSTVVLICLYIYFTIECITGEYSNYLKMVIEYSIYLIVYMVVVVYMVVDFAAVKRYKKVTAVGVLLAILAIVSVFNSILLIAYIAKRSYDLRDTLYYLTIAICYPFFDIALAMIIPKVITKTKLNIVETGNDFEDIYHKLEALKSEYEKGNISQEYYNTQRAELLNQL